VAALKRCLSAAAAVVSSPTASATSSPPASRPSPSAPASEEELASSPLRKSSCAGGEPLEKLCTLRKNARLRLVEPSLSASSPRSVPSRSVMDLCAPQQTLVSALYTLNSPATRLAVEALRKYQQSGRFVPVRAARGAATGPRGVGSTEVCEARHQGIEQGHRARPPRSLRRNSLALSGRKVLRLAHAPLAAKGQKFKKTTLAQTRNPTCARASQPPLQDSSSLGVVQPKCLPELLVLNVALCPGYNS